MKISKDTLRRVINEERQKLLNEGVRKNTRGAGGRLPPSSQEERDARYAQELEKQAAARGKEVNEVEDVPDWYMGGPGVKRSQEFSQPPLPRKDENHVRALFISTLQKAGIDQQQAIKGAQAILNNRQELGDLLTNMKPR
jgi:hypothetical protein